MDIISAQFLWKALTLSESYQSPSDTFIWCHLAESTVLLDFWILLFWLLCSGFVLPGEGSPISSNTLSQCWQPRILVILVCADSLQMPVLSAGLCPFWYQWSTALYLPMPYPSRELNFSAQPFCGKWDTSPESEHHSPSPEITLTSCVIGEIHCTTLNLSFLIHFLIVFTEGLSVIRNGKDKKGKVLTLRELILAGETVLQINNYKIAG